MVSKQENLHTSIFNSAFLQNKHCIKMSTLSALKIWFSNVIISSSIGRNFYKPSNIQNLRNSKFVLQSNLIAS